MHNFIMEDEARRLGLKVHNGDGLFKIVNVIVKLLAGIVREVELRDWFVA